MWKWGTCLCKGTIGVTSAESNQSLLATIMIAMDDDDELEDLGPVVQSVVSLTCLLRVISLTVLSDSIYNILIFSAEKNMSSFCKSYSHFFSKKFQHICISLDVNFNESLTNDVVSFEQLGPGVLYLLQHYLTHCRQNELYHTIY